MLEQALNNWFRYKPPLKSPSPHAMFSYLKYRICKNSSLKTNYKSGALFIFFPDLKDIDYQIYKEDHIIQKLYYIIIF